MTTTAQSVLDGLQKAMLLRVERANRRPKGRYSNTNYSGADLRAIRAQKGVGRPPMLAGWAKMPGTDLFIGRGTLTTADLSVPPMRAAIVEHGSQRAAARVLGLALSTFQRRLAKEAACA